MNSKSMETPDATARSRRRPVWLIWVVPIYWVGVFSLTHLPLPDTGSTFPHADKVVHMAIYSGLSFLLAAWFVADSRQVAWKIFFVCVSYAALDELTQIPIPTRSGDWRDWIADAIGTSVGLLAWFVIKRRWFDHSK